MAFQSTKTYGHEVGFSCAFRQWRATSHCNQLHGYALSFKFTFQAHHLDGRNWVVDFGGLRKLKAKLEYWFDHTTVAALDDPRIDDLRYMEQLGILTLRELPHVGCEKFAEHAFNLASQWLKEYNKELAEDYGLRVVSCEVSEHGANSAIYIGE